MGLEVPINDAIKVATEGSEIFLCARDSGHEEEVIVDKSVTSWAWFRKPCFGRPTNTAGFTITAANVSISGVAVDSTRSGLEIESTTGVKLDDIQVGFRELGSEGHR